MALAHSLHFFLLLISLAIFSLSRSAEGYIDDGFDFQYTQDKRASNLGGRLDSRNCAAFNVGKKFVGYSWMSGRGLRERNFFLKSNIFRDPLRYKMMAMREEPEKWMDN